MASMIARAPLPASLYAETAAPAPPTTALEGSARTRVAIVGGGFTGLSTALHLAEAGVDALVLEANAIGWGASGRNGGQVNPGLKWEPDALEETFGDLGRRMAALGAGAPDLVFDLVARHGIACGARRGGTLRAAVSRKAEAGIRTYQSQWAARGADVALLDAAGMAAATGTGAYPLGARDRRGGQVNPLGYARGLARAALAAGARIATETPVVRLAKSPAGWTLTTAGGATVEAERVVLATNGYSDDLWPGLRRSVVPVFSSITATAPLPQDVAAAIMPEGAVLYEMSAAYAYYRIDDAGRFVMGGRSVLRDSADPADYRGLVAHAERLFPALKGARWTHAWNGRVAVTRDELPHVHAPAEGLLAALGYNGRGVAMATAVGRMLARGLVANDLDALDLPVTRIAPIAGHVLWPLAVKARLAKDRVLEALGV